MQDMLAARRHGYSQMQRMQSLCEWKLVARSLANTTVLSAARDSLHYQRGDLPYYSRTLLKGDASSQDARKNRGTWLPVSLQRCTVSTEAEVLWVFDRLGPLVGHGGFDWHMLGFPDAGGFSSLVSAASPLWLVGSGYSPADAQGVALPMPPIHIHHMHVTSSQSYLGYANGHQTAMFPGRVNSDGVASAIEIDVHGDRQCAARDGGMACLFRTLPAGFGMRLTEEMQFFADLNDVRPQHSALLQFFSQNALQLSRAPRRRVGKALNAVGCGVNVDGAGSVNHLTSLFGHWRFTDDFMAHFDARHAQPQHYLVASAWRFPIACRLVHLYWHAHHEFTHDQLLFRGPPSALGLHSEPFCVWSGGRMSPWCAWWADPASPLNLGRHGWSVGGTLSHMLSSARASGRACHADADADPRTCPELLCSMDVEGRWDAPPGEARRERYTVPRCFEHGAIVVEPSDVFTQAWLGRVQHDDVLPAATPSIDKWMHSVLYAWYISADEDADTIPRSTSAQLQNAPFRQAVFAATLLCNGDALKRVGLLGLFSVLFIPQALGIPLWLPEDLKLPELMPHADPALPALALLLLVALAMALSVAGCRCCCRRRRTSADGGGDWWAARRVTSAQAFLSAEEVREEEVRRPLRGRAPSREPTAVGSSDGSYHDEDALGLGCGQGVDEPGGAAAAQLAFYHTCLLQGVGDEAALATLATKHGAVALPLSRQTLRALSRAVERRHGWAVLAYVSSLVALQLSIFCLCLLALAVDDDAPLAARLIGWTVVPVACMLPLNLVAGKALSVFKGTPSVWFISCLFLVDLQGALSLLAIIVMAVRTSQPHALAHLMAVSKLLSLAGFVGAILTYLDLARRRHRMLATIREERAADGYRMTRSAFVSRWLELERRGEGGEVGEATQSAQESVRAAGGGEHVGEDCRSGSSTCSLSEQQQEKEEQEEQEEGGELRPISELVADAPAERLWIFGVFGFFIGMIMICDAAALLAAYVLRTQSAQTAASAFHVLVSCAAVLSPRATTAVFTSRSATSMLVLAAAVAAQCSNAFVLSAVLGSGRLMPLATRIYSIDDAVLGIAASLASSCENLRVYRLRTRAVHVLAGADSAPPSSTPFGKKIAILVVAEVLAAWLMLGPALRHAHQ